MKVIQAQLIFSQVNIKFVLSPDFCDVVFVLFSIILFLLLSFALSVFTYSFIPRPYIISPGGQGQTCSKLVHVLSFRKASSEMGWIV